MGDAFIGKASMADATAASPDDPSDRDAEHNIMAERLRVFNGIISGVQSVVGEGAARSLLRFGAYDEGQRLARGLEGSRSERLELSLQMADRLLDHRSEGTWQDDGSVVMKVHGSLLFTGQNPLLETVGLAIMEGMMHSLGQRQFTAEITERGPGGTALIRFRPDVG